MQLVSGMEVGKKWKEEQTDGINKIVWLQRRFSSVPFVKSLSSATIFLPAKLLTIATRTFIVPAVSLWFLVPAGRQTFHITVSHLALNSIPTTPRQGTVAGLPQASGSGPSPSDVVVSEPVQNPPELESSKTPPLSPAPPTVPP